MRQIALIVIFKRSRGYEVRVVVAVIEGLFTRRSVEERVVIVGWRVYR